MKKALSILIPVIVCLLLGYAGGKTQIISLETWYPDLIKSPLTPPNHIFPIVWTILYVLMGLSIGIIILSTSNNKQVFIVLFCFQLFLNYFWSVLFFKTQNPFSGLIDIILLDIIVIIYIIVSFLEVKASSILFWPYVLWLLFATYLNFYIVLYN